MQKYGIIENEKLKIVNKNHKNAKPVEYTNHEFDQTHQGVFTTNIIENENEIIVKSEVREIEITEDENMDMMI
jgi:hypothetical protein